MINYIHAPHKRNFAEKQKKKTIKEAKRIRHIREGLQSVFGDNFKLHNEAELAKLKWIERRVLWDLINTPSNF